MPNGVKFDKAAFDQREQKKTAKLSGHKTKSPTANAKISDITDALEAAGVL